MKHILVVEDDEALAKGLAESLKREHFSVDTSSDGEEGFRKAKKKGVDLIILDLMLPTMNGEEVCRNLRKEGLNTPVIILTSKKEEASRVLGLELGADDYVTKPFSLLELHARIKAVMRRAERQVESVDKFAFGKIKVFFRRHEAEKGGKSLGLTEREFMILKYMIEHRGEVVTRDMLLDEVWGYETYPTTRTVDNYILSLRRKIEDVPSRPKYILTVPTAGYKFSA